MMHIGCGARIYDWPTGSRRHASSLCSREGGPARSGYGLQPEKWILIDWQSINSLPDSDWLVTLQAADQRALGESRRPMVHWLRRLMSIWVFAGLPTGCGGENRLRPALRAVVGRFKSETAAAVHSFDQKTLN